VKRKLILVVVALAAFPMIGMALFTSMKDIRVGGKELQVLGSLPEFTLQERNGKSLSSKELKGKVWVAGFIFTHCGGQCPLISAQMERLQRKLHHRSQFRLVSFSVDPTRDTPKVLSAYAKKYSADDNQWLFLTGETETVNGLLRNGFHVGAELKDGDIIHSDKLVLIDSKGQIRGYYDGTDPAAVDALAADAKHLIHNAG